MPLTFNAHAFRVVNQQINAEAGRVLGAAGLHFLVVPLLVHPAIQTNALWPKQPPDAPGAAVQRGIDPHFPAVLAAIVG